jgi:RNA polymerase sigma factor (sigma-70 family)
MDTSSTSLRSLIRKLQRLIRPVVTLGLTDAELLDRFARQRDEAAFTELLQRHGRMVLGVCLRILGDWHAAEDAYQATFLVLARRAGAGGWQASVGNWLYGVACRIARKERARLARRREQCLVEVDPVGATRKPDELASLLDEELSRLPDKYRAPLVLCYLEGRSNEEAARRLGWPVGTVWSHLSRGRQILRSRLERRGVALGAAALAALVGRDVATAATEALAERTSRAAIAFATGAAIEPALLSANALHLAKVGSAVMSVHRWAVVAAAVLLAAWATMQVGGGGSASPQLAATQPAPAADKKAMPARGPQRDPSADPAIRAGFLWLMKQQQGDGRWQLDMGVNNDVAATAMALLPLLAADAAREGSPAAKKFGPGVKKGLDYLVKKQNKEGIFDPLMYAQGMATQVLCEAYAQTGDPAHKKAAERGIDIIVKAQSADGAWRYAPIAGPAGDSSIAGWQCAALAAAERSGLPVPAETWKRYAGYLDQAIRPNGGYAYIGKGGEASIAPTAECLIGRLHTGWDATRPEFIRGVEWVEQQDASNVYAGYFVSLLMSRQGADAGWLNQYRATLVKTQQADGSWLKSGGWSVLMTTAFNLRSLQLHADYVPLAKAPALTDPEFDAVWKDLSAASPARAVRAMRTLTALPGRTVPLAKKELAPVKRADGKRIAELLVDLDNDAFDVRQRAEKELTGFGEGAAAELQEALKQPGKSLEFRRRLERVLEAASGQSPARMRELRTVRVLEYTATAEARKLLLDLAAGAPGAMLTKEARAALDRIEARGPATK